MTINTPKTAYFLAYMQVFDRIYVIQKITLWPNPVFKSGQKITKVGKTCTDATFLYYKKSFLFKPTSIIFKINLPTCNIYVLQKLILIFCITINTPKSTIF